MGAPRRQRPSVEQYKIVKRDGVVAALPDSIVMCQKRGVYSHQEEQQSQAILFRGRERLIHQRTELINALRVCLYEYGLPQGVP